VNTTTGAKAQRLHADGAAFCETMTVVSQREIYNYSSV